MVMTMQVWRVALAEAVGTFTLIFIGVDPSSPTR
jgi:glycerol uptake facilitator-like aquaporin